MRFVTEPQSLDEVRKLFEILRSRLHTAEPQELKVLMKTAVREYQPYLT